MVNTLNVASFAAASRSEPAESTARGDGLHGRSLRRGHFWHAAAAGSSPKARRQENVFMLFGKVAEETDGTFTDDVDEIYARRHPRVVTTHVVADRGDQHHEWKEVDIFHLTPEGRIREFWGIPDDQEALDHFFND